MKTTNKKPIKVIFLGIEGVLLTKRTQLGKSKVNDGLDFDPVMVDLLDSICSKYLCYIVVTSNIAKMCPASNDQEWFQSKVVQYGGGSLNDFFFPDDDLWKTTNCKLECKAFEIDDWFKKFDEKYGDIGYIDNYAIIDQESIGSVSMHNKHFIGVEDRHNGFGCSDYRKLVRVLEKEF